MLIISLHLRHGSIREFVNPACSRQIRMVDVRDRGEWESGDFQGCSHALQAWSRGMSARTEARRRRHERAATKVQTLWRRHVARVQYMRIRRAALAIQAAWRGKQARAVAADLRYCHPMHQALSVRAGLSAATHTRALAADLRYCHSMQQFIPGSLSRRRVECSTCQTVCNSK